ncbi:MAG: hypothetical protein U0232_21155 [Thermomicrobiales bacterium]
MMREIETLPDAFARDVIAHLCGETCHGVGQTVELCESRGDCVIVVNCGGCGKIFTLDDEQYEALVAWSEAHGESLACGIAPLAI